MGHNGVNDLGELRTVARLRQKLLSRLITSGTLSLAIIYPFTLLRALVIGFRAVDALLAAIFAFVVFILLLRKRLGPAAHAACILAAYLLSAVTTIGSYGVLAVAHVMVPFITIFAGMLFGRRVAITFLVVTTGAVSIIGVLNIVGVVTYQVDVRVFASSWTAWLNLVAFETLIAFWYLFMFAPINEAQEETAIRLSAILQGINDALFVHDKDTGAILEINERRCSMYG